MNANESAAPAEPSRFQNNYLFQAWLVLTLAAVFGISLAGVQQALGPVIETNKINETREKVPSVILGQKGAADLADSGGSLSIAPRTIEVEAGAQKKRYTVFEARHSDGRLAGWVTKASGQGYADKIELLLGFSPDAAHITGIYVLEQKETPGLGNKIVEEKWRAQFVKKSTDKRLDVVKGGAASPNDIDAITGATISSKSVTDIINRTAEDLKTRLASLSAESPKDK